jgi:hypothetical protein
MKSLILLCLVAALGAGGCSKGGTCTPQGPEATLPELTRALQTWIMTKGSLPADVNALTNFPTLQGKRLPSPPPGKKLAIDSATRQIVFVDQ